MKLNSRHKTHAKFDMSSMTDIVFLLLIFFMLITTMVVPNVNTLKLLLPNSNTAKPTENVTVSVAINDNLQYFVDGNKTSTGNLQAAITNYVKGKTNPVIILHTARTVPIENVVRIMDISNRLKVKMVLATDPEK